MYGDIIVQPASGNLLSSEYVNYADSFVISFEFRKGVLFCSRHFI